MGLFMNAKITSLLQASICMIMALLLITTAGCISIGKRAELAPVLDNDGKPVFEKRLFGREVQKLYIIKEYKHQNYGLDS